MKGFGSFVGSGGGRGGEGGARRRGVLEILHFGGLVQAGSLGEDEIGRGGGDSLSS